MNDERAIEGLKRLGLTTYEARVFLALQKLGSATASEVSEVAEVPRSQVYGAAEGLEKRGLVETQQSTPTVYRPVGLEQARRLLLDQLAETGAETFDYLETVQDTHEQQERSEAIWLLDGSTAIQSRSIELVDAAEQRLLYAVGDPELVDDQTLDALETAADRGVLVMLASNEDAVLDRVPASSAVKRYPVPDERTMDVDVGRLLLADDQTLLLSTFTGDGTGDVAETAFWTSENLFAKIIVQLAEEWFREPFED
jgi:sugar-specific transcriptional regulator TrmB